MNDASMTRFSDSGMAYTKNGSGPALILLHGWPFHKATFRNLIPLLTSQYTCYALDSLGMGESTAKMNADFSFGAHADRVLQFADHIDQKTFSILGHDTGGTIARLVAAKALDRVEKLIVADSEMPGHIPGVVPKFQQLLGSGNRLIRWIFAQTLKSKAISRWNFRNCFHDPEYLTDQFLDLFVAYWPKTNDRLNGLIGYLMAIDHQVIDALSVTHKEIQCPTLTIWGRHDAIFPIELARKMVADMPTCKVLTEIPEAGFLSHEENPKQIAKHIIDFLSEEWTA